MVMVISGNAIRQENIQIQPMNPTLVRGNMQTTSLQKQQKAYAEGSISALDTMKRVAQRPASYTELEVLTRTAGDARRMLDSKTNIPSYVSGTSSDMSNGLYRQQMVDRNAKLIVGNSIIDRSRTPQIIPSDYTRLMTQVRY
jgi:hypothetical protein